MVVLYISCAVDPQSNTPPDSYSAASHFGVLQIGIRAKVIENQIKNILLDYNHFQNIALVQKGLHGTFMHTFMHMLVAALVDTIMSDSEDSTVTYTTVSSPYEGRSRDVSPGVDGLPVMPEDPYTYVVAAFQALPPPDYVPGPEEPEQAPPSPVYIPYIPEPVYPEFIPPEDDVFPTEEQPLPAAASPTTDSPGYIPKSDPDEDPEDDNDEDPKEDPADYPADHDDDEEEEEPSGDDVDEEDEEQDEDDDEEEEEHPASADSIAPPPALRVTDMISFGPQPLTLSFTKKDAERADRPEVTLPPQKSLSIVHCPGYEAGESSVAAAARPIEGRRADYGFVDSVEAEIRRRRAEDIGYGIRDTWIDTTDVAEEGRQTKIFQRVKALVDDRQYHYETGRLVDQEARFSQEAWAHSMGLGSGHLAMALGEIRALQAREQARAGAPEGAGALTWWNYHVRIVGNDVAYVMTWIELKKKMADKYCLRNEIKKIEAELWNLEVQEESDRVERYIGGLPDTIHGSVTESKPKTMQEATEMATGLMDKKIRTYAKRQAANKRKFEDTSRNNQVQQQPPKRQDVARAYAAGSDHDYAVELANGRIVGVNNVIRSCTLNFLNRPFNIDLMPVEMGSFDVMIGMDWLSRYQAVIVCADKIVRIPWGRETLIFHGDGSNQEHETRLNIISCAKMQEYMLKGCQVFLAHVTTKEAEGKSEKKR
nr:reverse transcriptase domain-containing protein [Tanacetum cinerariifolium]